MIAKGPPYKEHKTEDSILYWLTFFFFINQNKEEKHSSDKPTKTLFIIQDCHENRYRDRPRRQHWCRPQRRRINEQKHHPHQKQHWGPCPSERMVLMKRERERERDDDDDDDDEEGRERHGT